VNNCDKCSKPVYKQSNGYYRCQWCLFDVLEGDASLATTQEFWGSMTDQVLKDHKKTFDSLSPDTKPASGDLDTDTKKLRDNLKQATAGDTTSQSEGDLTGEPGYILVQERSGKYKWVSPSDIEDVLE
jgi:hypothetical protein